MRCGAVNVRVVNWSSRKEKIEHGILGCIFRFDLEFMSCLH